MIRAQRHQIAENYTNVPAGAANTVVFGNPCVLCKVIVQAAGTGSTDTDIFDNATTNSGTKLFTVPKAAAQASIYDLQIPALLGIVVANDANGPVLNVTYL